MEVDKGIKLEGTKGEDFVNSGVKVKKEYEECIGCLELQDKIEKANDKCAYMELDIVKKNSVIEWLEGKLGFMELKKLGIEDEVRVLRQRNEELEKSIRNGDKFNQLMIENEVLECEKSKAESEIEVWKVKCKELEIQVLELEKRLCAGTMKTGSDLGEMYSRKISHVGSLMHGFNVAGGPSVVRTETENKANEDKDASGTTPVSTPSTKYTDAEGFKGGHQCELKPTVRKCLDFAAEESPHKNISPSTPGGRPPFGPIDISDSDDDLNTVRMHGPDLYCKERKKVRSSSGVGLGITLDEKELTLKDRHEAAVEHLGNEEETTCYTGRQPYLRMPRRRKVRRGVVTSESESNDNIPICRLRSKNQLTHSSDTLLKRGSVNGSCFRDNPEKLTPRRRLRRVGDREDKGVSGQCSCKSTGNQTNLGISEIMNDTLGGDEMEEDDSSSEGESLGGFIVDSSDDSESDSGSNCNDKSEHNGSFSGDCSGESENASESSIAYDEVISGFRRERKDKLKWEFEADMLADFGKCPELCMKAVCALYRQQTSEEKSCKATILVNGRGFNQIHAYSGSALAEFLTDGDPQGDMKKTVEELQEFNSKGVELCRKLATHYSKQLFEIYKNEEDPFLHP